jgi:hypothetical protein
MKTTKYTYEEVKHEFTINNCTLISTEYINCTTKLEYICNLHINKGIQITDFDHFKNHHQTCKYCSKENILKKYITNYMNSKEYTITGINFNGSKSSINYICPKHQDKGIQTISLKSIYNKHGCPYCGSEKVKSHPHPTRTNENEIINYINSLGDINYLGMYFKNGRARVKYECLKHKNNIPLEKDYNNFKRQKYFCNDCYRESKLKQTFVEDIHELNPNIEILSEYLGDEVPVQCRCKLDNKTWSVTPCSLIAHPTCPKFRKSISNCENQIRIILDKFNFKNTFQKRFNDCRDKYVLPFDYYLDDFNILIEYDGEDHYFPIQRGNHTFEEAIKIFIDKQKKDKIKTEYCKFKNIPLIRIPYWENENLEYYLFEQLVKHNVIEKIKNAS